VNAQELFLDVSSGRFLDGATAIPTTKPIIYSDEQKRIRLNTFKVKGTTLTSVTPSNDSRLKVRFGTSALKLADGTDVTTAPDNLITAIATVATAASSQAIGLSKISTYTPVTATLVAGVVTYPIVTAGFSASIDYRTPVTAIVSVGIGTITLPGFSIELAPSLSGITDVIKPSIFGRVLSFTSTLNTPDTATFAAVISGGSVTTIGITSRGGGYQDGSYGLSFVAPNPTAATFTATISGGVVVAVSIVTGGSGYGAGPFDLAFGATTGTIAAATASSLNGSINQITITDGGSDYTTAPQVTLATAPAVVAIATAVASQDKIQSITINNAGSGYAATPAVTLFMPAKRVIAVEPTNKISNVVSGSIFSWVNGLASSATVGLLFSSPDNLSTPIPSSVPSAFIYFQSGNTWKLQLISSGYGYTTAPTVIHNDALVLDNTLDYEVVRGEKQIGSGSFQDRNPSFFNSTVKGIAKKPQGGSAVLISSGGIAPDYRVAEELFGVGSIFGFNAAGDYRVAQQYVPDRFLSFRSISSNEATARGLGLGAGQVQFLPQPQQGAVFTIVNTATEYDASLKSKFAPNELFPKPTSRNIIVKTFDPQHSKYSDRQFLAVLVPQTTEKPTRYAVCRITIPPATKSYFFLQNGNAIPKKGAASSWESAWETYDGGGVLEPKISWLDYGAGYTVGMTAGGFRLVEISSLPNEYSILDSSGERTITAITSFDLGGFAQNLFSRPASVATRPGQRGVQYFVSDGGFGYFGKTVLSISQASISGGIVTASIANTPINYTDGIYSCSVASAPGLGTTAQISIAVSNGIHNAVVLNSGFGYTTAPTITAPAPNFQSGQVVALSVATQPFGYTRNINHPLSFSASSVCGGDAQATFLIDDSGNVRTQIQNQGFGYSSIPSVAAKDPDLRSLNGYVGSIQLSNSPEGYVVGREYALTIQQSPTANGTARGVLVKADSSRYDITIVCRGFGYTSAPLITAPAPDKNNGVVNNVSVTTYGKGYSSGTYQCLVTTAPAGGETAEVSFVVNDYKNASFVVNNAGYGYVVAPSISVPTPSGRILSSISITCAGSFYTPSTATFSLVDDTGDGATFKTIVSSGRVIGVQVANPGYGFSDKPIILFSSPVVTPPSDVLQNQVDFDLNITVASANAILSTATQRDILMEVYETDGTNEQVISQATVSLAKRVLE
jgi:hypothetical protein